MSRIYFAFACVMFAFLSNSFAVDPSMVQRGEYLYHAADCRGCHTKGQDELPIGGRAIETPFGIFYSPNITPDRENGVGSWSDEDFIHALRDGVAPGGKQLFPVFPYTSYSYMSDEDIKAIRAYIMTLPSSPQKNREHDIKFPFGFRPLMAIWKMLFFHKGPLQENKAESPDWNRGRYLVKAVVHCTECHTPRSKWTGVVDGRREFSGNIGGPDRMNAPNITSDTETGIGTWSVDEIMHLLKTGETPDYELVSSGMTSVVRGTRLLNDGDRHAIAVYIKTIAPIRSKKIPLKSEY